MNLLLDTHAFLWFIEGSPKLSATARSEIEAQANAKCVSVASLWEIAIKFSLGRLEFQQPFEVLIPAQLESNGFSLLPLRISHFAETIRLPFHHRDPFDRILAAQCMTEKMSVVSADTIFDRYSIPRCW
ncbi:MAG: type II toxin-antitoxin system VapC family toxin [Planctomycetes bacterium]|nr:type II toxin-antitoxin system VapC family toxin [Planctomycetota bacterium]MBU4400405.1 type II toxin-antitoxin system VapC family toxin [Planctomycetota bacterium]MCG2682047.1 type II toxin-antitoxin system VapC family toxin [Planctomycetales bacterium]